MKAVLLLLLLAASQAGAADRQAPDEAAPAGPLPVCRLDPQDNTRLAVEPCATAPPVQPRRAVAQVIGRMPATQMSPPVVHYQTLPAPGAAPVPGAPLPVNSCDSGGCRDAGGARYNGAGDATLDANGRICHRNGAFIQCF